MDAKSTKHEEAHTGCGCHPDSCQGTIAMTPERTGKFAELKAAIEEAKADPEIESRLIGILHKAQNLFGYLEEPVMELIAEEMRIPTAHIWGVATFYHFFNLTPRGRHTISVCLGTACYIKGADKILDSIKKELGVGPGGTSADGLFTLAETRCLGACGLAPLVMIDEKIHGELTTAKMRTILKQYRKAAEAEKTKK